MAHQFKLQRKDFILASRAHRAAVSGRGRLALKLTFQRNELLIESEFGGSVVPGEIDFEAVLEVVGGNFISMIKQHRFNKMDGEWLRGRVDAELQEVSFEKAGINAKILKSPIPFTPQVEAPEQPKLSLIDALLQIGEESGSFIESTEEDYEAFLQMEEPEMERLLIRILAAQWGDLLNTARESRVVELDEILANRLIGMLVPFSLGISAFGVDGDLRFYGRSGFQPDKELEHLLQKKCRETKPLARIVASKFRSALLASI